MVRQASSRAQPSGSPRTEYATFKINFLAVRPEPVEGPAKNWDTVSQGGGDFFLYFNIFTLSPGWERAGEGQKYKGKEGIKFFKEVFKKVNKKADKYLE